MGDIQYRSDIVVSPAQHCGTDRDIAFAAWAIPPVSRRGPHAKDDSPEGCARVLRACMKGRHNTPFEHGLLSVYVEAPGVVWWQLTRQRFMSLDSEDFSFNLESGRYKVLEPEFYVPSPERPVAEPDGFKPMRPALAPGDVSRVEFDLRRVCRDAWATYESLIEDGYAREVARLVLPNWALYCDGYVTAKPLTWLQFFSKRRRTGDTAVPTFPQWEIEQFATACEALFAERWPITYSLFVEFGRVAP